MYLFEEALDSRQVFGIETRFIIFFISVMELGHLLARSSLRYPEVSSKVYHDSFCRLGSSVSLPWVIYFEAFYLHVVSSFSCIPVICPKLLLLLTPLQFLLETRLWAWSSGVRITARTRVLLAWKTIRIGCRDINILLLICYGGSFPGTKRSERNVKQTSLSSVEVEN